MYRIVKNLTSKLNLRFSRLQKNLWSYIHLWSCINLTHKLYQGSTRDHRLVQVLTDSGAWISEPDFLMTWSKKGLKTEKQPMLLKVADNNPELAYINLKIADDKAKVADHRMVIDGRTIVQTVRWDQKYDQYFNRTYKKYN